MGERSAFAPRHGIDVSNAEIKQFDDIGGAIFRRQHHVIGFHIAMDDAVFAGTLEGAQELTHDERGIERRQTPHGTESMRQRFAIEPLHHKIELARRELAKVDSRTNIGMIECTSRLGFASKSLDIRLFHRNIAVENLYRKAFGHVDVFGFVNRTHIAPP